MLRLSLLYFRSVSLLDRTKRILLNETDLTIYFGSYVSHKRHVVLAWELGGGYGHIAGFIPLADELRKNNCRISWILRDTKYFHALCGMTDDMVLQAPFSHPKAGVTIRPVNNFSDLLSRHGCGHANELIGLVGAWRSLFKLLKPDLLICDHSPMAIFAARGGTFPVASYGTGFFLPPAVSPWPGLQPFKAIDEEKLLESDTLILNVFNSSLSQLGEPGLQQMSDLFDIDTHFLCTFPELDHYHGRKTEDYWGPRMDVSSGVEPVWPKGNGPRVFAYLKENHSSTGNVIAALAELGWPSLVHFTGGKQSDIDTLSCSSIVISNEHLHMGQLVQQADLFINHAGHGTISASLLGGKPSLMIPSQQEQLLLAKAVAQYGLGILGKNNGSSKEIIQWLKGLDQSETIKAQCRFFAAKYQDFDTEEQVQLIAEHCLEMMSQ
jgi:hypothetical protein